MIGMNYHAPNNSATKAKLSKTKRRAQKRQQEKTFVQPVIKQQVEQKEEKVVQQDVPVVPSKPVVKRMTSVMPYTSFVDDLKKPFTSANK